MEKSDKNYILILQPIKRIKKNEETYFNSNSIYGYGNASIS